MLVDVCFGVCETQEAKTMMNNMFSLLLCFVAPYSFALRAMRFVASPLGRDWNVQDVTLQLMQPLRL
jgi:hypothetical protein